LILLIIENRSKVISSPKNKAYKDGLYGRRYQWIISGLYEEKWWELPSVECNKEELLAALDGYIATDVLPLSSSQKTDFGLVSAFLFRDC
jgi:hypothetical protein